ncbi:MAG: DegT/DnrJ/EryC1/StrS family aminotransferase [Candidatus Obscuribacterales bacterium]|nr:DegT/DnrJ/EryC1/StrS family aminotransferase [Candidatus Obscuribacterales bacterium]
MTQATQKVPVLGLKEQYQPIADELEANVLAVLRSGNYILGEHVKGLEGEVAKLSSAQEAVGVANGTDALILALWALDIGPGDEVITSPFTFAATVEAIAIRGAKPVFVDIDPDTFNINTKQIEAVITKKTKAILPVHLYGHPADMDPIMELAKKYKLFVIEDNAQAIAATYKGKTTGSFGDVGCISFYPTKNLGAAGDAGMVTANNKDVADRLRKLRAHGMWVRYYHDELGVNSRLDEIQAVILRTKLKHLSKWNDRRRQIANLYETLLKNCPGITLPKTSTDVTHVFHQYTIRVHNNNKTETKGRDVLQAKLAESGIGSMIYYPVPLHLQKAFSQYGYAEGDFPVTELVSDEVLSLPMYPELTDAQVKLVAESIKTILNAPATAPAVSQPVAGTV